MLNLKHAFRTLFKSPFVTIIAVLSLGLGIGANAAIYSLFDQMLLRPTPGVRDRETPPCRPTRSSWRPQLQSPALR